MPYSRVSFRMNLSDHERLSEIFNDMNHRAVSVTADRLVSRDCIVFMCGLTDDFDYCGLLLGENTANAEKLVAVTSVRMRDGKIPITRTTGRNWWTMKKVRLRFRVRSLRSLKTLARSRCNCTSSLATESRKTLSVSSLINYTTRTLTVITHNFRPRSRRRKPPLTC